MPVDLTQTAKAKQSPWSIVPGTAEDAGAIAVLGAEVFSKSFAHSTPAEDLQKYLQTSYSVSRIQSQLEDKAHTFYLAKDPGGSLLGFVQITEGSSEPCITLPASEAVELQRIYTSSQSHGSGIGSALLQRAIRHATPKFKLMWLGVWEENVKAQRFYQRYGFERVGEHDFVMGSCVQTDWILQKPLNVPPQ